MTKNPIITTNDALVAEVVDLLGDIRQLLDDRLPPRAPQPAAGTVELREPEAPASNPMPTRAVKKTTAS